MEAEIHGQTNALAVRCKPKPAGEAARTLAVRDEAKRVRAPSIYWAR